MPHRPRTPPLQLSGLVRAPLRRNLFTRPQSLSHAKASASLAAVASCQHARAPRPPPHDPRDRSTPPTPRPRPQRGRRAHRPRRTLVDACNSRHPLERRRWRRDVHRALSLPTRPHLRPLVRPRQRRQRRQCSRGRTCRRRRRRRSCTSTARQQLTPSPRANRTLSRRRLR